MTKREYETARERDIPIFIFVEKNIMAEYQTYKDNKDIKAIKYHHVDSINIYRLLDEILAQRRNNFVKEFEKFDEIASWLRDQWAGLFADFLAKKSSETTLKDLGSQISSLAQISNVLKAYSESIMRKVEPEQSEHIIAGQEELLLIDKIRRFAEEPMIEHILRTSGRADLNSRTIYTAFAESKSLEDFLNKLDLGEEFTSDFLHEYKSLARKDYIDLGYRYFKEGELDPKEQKPK